MTEIFIYAILLITFYFVFKAIFKQKIQTYDTGFWAVVECVWLIMSFTGVSIGLYELNRIKTQFDYKETESNLASEYQDIRNGIYGQTMVMIIDSATSPNRRESINWFHTVQRLLEDGYKNNMWRKFVYYTRAYVFEERGCLSVSQDNVLIFKWPENINLKSKDIELKSEIRFITDKLIHFEESIDNVEKLKPEDKPLFFIRYIFVFLFTVALSLKLLKTYADYIKTIKK